MRYVIIGNSAAAVGCIEGIRQKDKDGGITVISNEPYHTYSRPLISYLLLGKTDAERMKYRPDDFYEKNGVTLLLSETAEKIDSLNKLVILKSGKEIPYDRLMVAAGSAPFVPPIDGFDSVNNRFTFMTIDDALALEKKINKDSKVLVMGAGLIGLKCVEGILDKVSDVTVVDLASRILPSILDEEGSQIVFNHLQKKGVKFILGDGAVKFEANSALLSSGRKVDFDVLVTAAGVRPNTKLLKDIGAEVNRGIVINSRGETSVPDIYSAGDCTETTDISSGDTKIMALLPNAYMQGEAAGINMAGGDADFDKAIPMNAVGFFGLHIISAGNLNGESYVAKTSDSYKRLVTKDGYLVGYIMIGDVQRAGIYTSLIRERKPLNTIDFELIKEKPQLMAFSKRERARQLGGVSI